MRVHRITCSGSMLKRCKGRKSLGTRAGSYGEISRHGVLRLDKSYYVYPRSRGASTKTISVNQAQQGVPLKLVYGYAHPLLLTPRALGVASSVSSRPVRTSPTAKSWCSGSVKRPRARCSKSRRRRKRSWTRRSPASARRSASSMGSIAS